MTEPLKQNTTVVGAGALHVWVRASKPRVDLQATITEVRPDGKETFVQGGWLRGDMRGLFKSRSTPLEPVLGLRSRDLKPLPRKRFVEATIPLYYEGHAYRAGSRIRVILSAPNGDQPIWSFTTKPKGKAKVTIAHGAKRPSDLTLPTIPGVDVPTDLPPCPGLRGEPCRDFAG
jgi:predicted acyl esterase